MQALITGNSAQTADVLRGSRVSPFFDPISWIGSRLARSDSRKDQFRACDRESGSDKDLCIDPYSADKTGVSRLQLNGSSSRDEMEWIEALSTNCWSITSGLIPTMKLQFGKQSGDEWNMRERERSCSLWRWERLKPSYNLGPLGMHQYLFALYN